MIEKEVHFIVYVCHTASVADTVQDINYYMRSNANLRDRRCALAHNNKIIEPCLHFERLCSLFSLLYFTILSYTLYHIQQAVVFDKGRTRSYTLL